MWKKYGKIFGIAFLAGLALQQVQKRGYLNF